MATRPASNDMIALDRGGLMRKLDNPFLLVVEGFVAGAFLFWMTAPTEVQARPDRPAAAAEAPSLP